MTRSQGIRQNEGVALVTALALLVIFMLFGLAWVEYMEYEQNLSKHQIQILRVNKAAEGGINAGIQAARDVVASGVVTAPPEPFAFDIPVYVASAADAAPAPDANLVCRVQVRFEDESARININHAPPAVLREILGVDGEKAREIRSSLPRTEGGEENKLWFASVEELAARFPVAKDAMTPELKKMLTVYTVPDPAQATGYMNVNTAPARVITALLDVTPGVAAQIVESRPFSDVTELSAAAGKDPATFNVRPAPDALNTLPVELSFGTRCFRIHSSAELIKSDNDANSQVTTATARFEAIVYIDELGNPHVMYWNESAQRDESDAGQEPAAESPSA
jgi:type II secretory pathway component PulK